MTGLGTSRVVNKYAFAFRWEEMTSCADFLWMIADDKDVYIFAWSDYSRYGRDSTVHVAMLAFLHETMAKGGMEIYAPIWYCVLMWAFYDGAMFSGITAVHVRFDRLFLQDSGYDAGRWFYIWIWDEFAGLWCFCQNIFCVRAESSWRTFQLLCMFTLQLEFVLEAFSAWEFGKRYFGEDVSTGTATLLRVLHDDGIHSSSAAVWCLLQGGHVHARRPT